MHKSTPTPRLTPAVPSRAHRSCGPLSAACQGYLQMEACFYECDHNIGRFRKNKNPSCLDPDGSVNQWQIQNLPLSGALADAWFNACKNDLFCTDATGSYFNLPEDKCTPPVPPAVNTSTCRFFKDIYGNATNMVSQMWDSSFVYSTNPNASFTFPTKGQAPFTMAKPNPNDGMAPSVPNPPFCSSRFVVNGMIQALSDIQLYASNMLKYAGMKYTGSLMTSPLPGTYATSWRAASAVSNPNPVSILPVSPRAGTPSPRRRRRRPRRSASRVAPLPCAVPPSRPCWPQRRRRRCWREHLWRGDLEFGQPNSDRELRLRCLRELPILTDEADLRAESIRTLPEHFNECGGSQLYE